MSPGTPGSSKNWLHEVCLTIKSSASPLTAHNIAGILADKHNVKRSYATTRVSKILSGEYAHLFQRCIDNPSQNTPTIQINPTLNKEVWSILSSYGDQTLIRELMAKETESTLTQTQQNIQIVNDSSSSINQSESLINNIQNVLNDDPIRSGTLIQVDDASPMTHVTPMAHSLDSFASEAEEGSQDSANKNSRSFFNSLENPYWKELCSKIDNALTAVRSKDLVKAEQILSDYKESYNSALKTLLNRCEQLETENHLLRTNKSVSFGHKVHNNVRVGRRFLYHQPQSMWGVLIFVNDHDKDSIDKVVANNDLCIVHKQPLLKRVILRFFCNCKLKKADCPTKSVLQKCSSEKIEAKLITTLSPRIKFISKLGTSFESIIKDLSSKVDTTDIKFIKEYSNSEKSFHIAEIPPGIRSTLLKIQAENFVVVDTIKLLHCTNCWFIGHRKQDCKLRQRTWNKATGCVRCPSSRNNHHPFSFRCPVTARAIQAKINKTDYGPSHGNIVLWQWPAKSDSYRGNGSQSSRGINPNLVPLGSRQHSIGISS